MQATRPRLPTANPRHVYAVQAVDILKGAGYRARRTEAGVPIRYVIDTHVHADHVSAARAIQRATGAEYVLWSGANVAFPFHPVDDGVVLEAGNVRVDVLHAPGHTPEHIALLITPAASKAPE